MLWYLNRSTGLVLLAVFTVSTVLGILASRSRAGGRVPAFVTRDLHRNLALFSVLLLTGHVASAVLDSYVDIRWWQAFVPFWGATYKPTWLGLGTLVLDLWLAIVVTTTLRHRLGLRAWRAIHLAAYAAWPIAVLHTWGIGTDVHQRNPVALAVLAGSVGLVVAASAWRLTTALTARTLEALR